MCVCCSTDARPTPIIYCDLPVLGSGTINSNKEALSSKPLFLASVWIREFPKEEMQKRVLLGRSCAF